MLPELRYYLGILGIVIGFIGYYPYFRDIFRGKTIPHAFSRLIRGMLTGTGFVVQIYGNGGFGSWVLGTTSIMCFAIAFIGFYQARITYTKLDYILLGGAVVSLGVWCLTKDPVYSVLLISIVDAVAFLPTYKKIYQKPHSETLSSRYMMNVRMVIGIAALTTFSFATAFYPGVIFALNTVSIVLIHRRRREK